MGANGDQSTEKDPKADSPRIYNGQIRRVVDEKSRLNIPSRWRDPRYTEFHALPDSNNPCLRLLNADELWRMKRTLDESTAYSAAEKKKFRRRWFSRATPCPIDRQGRIVIPPDLQKRYQFSGEVVIVGACECLELWHPSAWEAEEAKDDLPVDAMADELGF